MSTHQRQKLLALLLSRRGEWITASEIAEVGGLQYGARIFEIRHELGYEIESRTERVRTGAGRHSVIRRSWFRLLTPRQIAAFAIGQGKSTPEIIAAAAKDDSEQPSLFSSLPERHKDDS